MRRATATATTPISGPTISTASSSFDLSPAVKVTAILGYTDFYNGNAEGLNLAWFSADPSVHRKLANPDAYSLAEYQKTPAWYRQMFGVNRVPGQRIPADRPVHQRPDEHDRPGRQPRPGPDGIFIATPSTRRPCPSSVIHRGLRHPRRFPPAQPHGRRRRDSRTISASGPTSAGRRSTPSSIPTWATPSKGPPSWPIRP